MTSWALNKLTLRGLYIFFAVGTAAWIGAWIAFENTRWVDTWAPNFAAEFGGAFVTVAVVEFIVDRRERPLRDFAAKRIDHAILALLQTPMNYRTRLSKDVPETLDPSEMLRDWQRELARQLPAWDWLVYWGKYLASPEPLLSNVRDRYDRVLPERLLTALDDFALWGDDRRTDITWAHTIDGARRSQVPDSRLGESLDPRPLRRGCREASRIVWCLRGGNWPPARADSRDVEGRACTSASADCRTAAAAVTPFGLERTLYGT